MASEFHLEDSNFSPSCCCAIIKLATSFIKEAFKFIKQNKLETLNAT